MKRLLSLAILAGIGFGLYFSFPTPPRETFVGIVDEVMDSCVTIVVRGTKDGEPSGALGSGVYISKTGHILTAAHLFNSFQDITDVTVERVNGDILKARIINVAKGVDLALIQTMYPEKTPGVHLADPRYLKVGQEVFAIGAPLGLDFTVTHGIISALYRDFEHSYNVTQSDTVINPGNSGGPLFNLKGELVGINVFMITSGFLSTSFTGLGFSVQSGECLKFLTDCKKLDKELRLI